MRSQSTGRRDFLTQAGGTTGLAWLSMQWPAVLAAAEHAHQAAISKTPVKFQVLTPAQARDVQAIAAQIIPTDDLPGAREAGVVYFIDRALKTFASSSLPLYQNGLAKLDEMIKGKHPHVQHFADATEEQQRTLLEELDRDSHWPPGQGLRSVWRDSGDFFPAIWQHVVIGFLIDPSAGGNQDYAGWKVLERDPVHSFAPPFGFYDKDYPGWQKAMEAGGKK